MLHRTKPSISLNKICTIHKELGLVHEMHDIVTRALLLHIHIILTSPLRYPKWFLEGGVEVVEILNELCCVDAIPI